MNEKKTDVHIFVWRATPNVYNFIRHLFYKIDTKTSQIMIKKKNK